VRRSGNLSPQGGARAVGWGVELRLTIEAVTVGRDEAPLVHHRGRYRTIT